MCHIERKAWQQPVNTVEISNELGAAALSGALVLLFPSEVVQLQNLEHPRRKKGKLEPIPRRGMRRYPRVSAHKLTYKSSVEGDAGSSPLVGSLISCQQKFPAGGSLRYTAFLLPFSCLWASRNPIGNIWLSHTSFNYCALLSLAERLKGGKRVTM